MPRWFPRGIVSRAESWIIEESEVDPFGRVVKCLTKNLDHVKVMQVEESAQLTQTADGYVVRNGGLHILITIHRKTLQHTEARIFSRFGWGLTKKIENHGLSRFKANLQRVRRSMSPYSTHSLYFAVSLGMVLVSFSAFFANLECKQ